MIVRNKPLYANFALLRADTEGDVRWDSNEPTALRAGFELLAVSARIYISSTEPFWKDTTTHQPSSSKGADFIRTPNPDVHIGVRVFVGREKRTFEQNRTESSGIESGSQSGLQPVYEQERGQYVSAFFESVRPSQGRSKPPIFQAQYLENMADQTYTKTYARAARRQKIDYSGQSGGVIIPAGEAL